MANKGQIGDNFPRKFGKYHLLGPLAQGGMGALYLAVTGGRGLERLLVIKTVLPHLADKEYIARFRDEAKVVVKLSHRNLIPVFDAGQVGGELFLAMDFVEGKDLRAVWNQCAKKQVAFPIDVAAYIVKELARGLDYAHAYADLKLVHRDVSPPNVLISYTGEVKLTDFGLASSTMKLETTAPGIIYGKVAYMSPEQARGEALDGRSDLYAAGIVLWELLTGRQLFPPGSEQPHDLLRRARDPNITPPSKRAPRVPESLDAICVKALAGRPEDRYETGEDMRVALAGWLAVESPATDSARVDKFLHKLFSDDIERDRSRREKMIEGIRQRIHTLAPTDELRVLIEESEGIAIHGRKRNDKRPGRRASDLGDDLPGRRLADMADGPQTERGVAVRVPAPGPGGRTVVTPATGASASASAALATAQYDLDALDDSQHMLGQIVDGRYRIDELIGEGGMGRVYLAEHVDIGKLVAVKILHPVYSRMPDLVERFRREARAASRIGHPHIVDVTDSGTTEDGSVYFVMEYLRGVELGSVIDREGALDIRRSLRIATQICRALSAAHASGIIHRDLKPENIFLTVREGTSDFVKVLDFGIAKSIEGEQARAKKLTSPGMAMGTPEYMAPEQAAGRPADERCDVYALGAILWETLTGAPPYEGANFMEILTKKATIDPPPAKELRPEVPDEVNELVTRALARNPDDRPRSMDAFEYELTKCLSGRGTAVANILGMTTDANLVASLNPGLSMRFEDGGLTRRGRDRGSGSQPSIVDDRTAEDQAMAGGYLSPVRLRTDGVSEGYPLASERPPTAPPAPEPSAPTFDDVGYDSGTAPIQSRSRLGLFGWIVLAALLATGVGVMLFVVAGERSGRSKSSAAAGLAGGDEAKALVPDPEGGTETQGSDEANDGDDDGADGDDDDDGDDGEVDGDNGGDASAAANAKRDAERRKKKRDAERRKKDTPAPVVSLEPMSKADAKKLLDEAKSFVSKLDWASAEDAYSRVAKGKHYKAQGLLGLAKVAFEQKQHDKVITYATRALQAGAGDSARVLLGHAYYKKGEYAQALKYYEAVLKKKPDDREAQKGARAARQALGQ